MDMPAARPLTGGDIAIWVGTSKLGAAEWVGAKAEREVRPVEAAGSAQLVGLVPGPVRFTVEIRRVKMADTDAEVDLSALSAFSLTIAAPGRTTVFSGCEWVALEESAEPGRRVLEKAVVAARARTVTAGLA